MKKYRLTNNTIEYEEHTLHQIIALKSFANVNTGDLGGWIESEDNLSQEGYCWVFDNAKVFDNARVCENAIVLGNAEVCENAIIYGNAEVFDNALINGDAEVFGNAMVYDNAMVTHNAKVYDNAQVYGYAKLFLKSQASASELISGGTFYGDDTNVEKSTTTKHSVIDRRKLI